MPIANDVTGSSAREPIMSEYIVAYCDILGQREKLDLLKKTPGSAQETSEFRRLYEETYGAVLDLRNRVRAALQSSLHDAAQNIPNFRDHHTTRTPCHIAFFSDCVAVTLRYCDDNGHPPLLDIWHLLIALSIATIRCVGAGTPLRGAVEVGRGFEWPDGGVYGPITADVYELERQVAGYPRIIVGSELLARIRDCDRRVRQQEQYYVCNKNWIKRCNGIIVADKDGISVLDYLGSDGFYWCSPLPGIKEAVESGYKFVDAECERLRDEGYSKKMSMYYLLRDYYSTRRAEFWGASD